MPAGAHMVISVVKLKPQKKTCSLAALLFHETHQQAEMVECLVEAQVHLSSSVMQNMPAPFRVAFQQRQHSVATAAQLASARVLIIN